LSRRKTKENTGEKRDHFDVISRLQLPKSVLSMDSDYPMKLPTEGVLIIMCRQILSLLLLVLLALPRSAPAVEIIPFQTRNQNPLIQIFGLPAIGDARVLPPGKYAAGLYFDLANSYTVSGGVAESLLLDGESYRFNLILKGGLTDGFEAGIELPWLAYGGGTIDGFIEDWHQFFGLPNGGRNSAPNNRLRYQYTRNGLSRLDIRDAHSGIGDLMFTGGWQFYGDTKSPQAASLRAAVKVPTGDSATLIGSGSTDLSLWAIGRSDYQLSFGRATLYGAVGGMYLTRGDVLPDLQANWVAFGSLGAGLSPWEVIAFTIQLDASTPFYHGSRLNAVSGNTLGLMIGGSLALGSKTTLELGVMEDLAVGTFPDVTFHMGLTHRF
jgi:hypothetical protein